MASSDFEIIGMDDTLNKLDEMAKWFGNERVGQKAVLPALREAGQILSRAAALRAPVDTGVLKSSIKVKARAANAGDKKSDYYAGETALALVGLFGRTNTIQKILAQEFGTAEQPGKPFLRPAAELRGQRAVQILKVRLNEAIEKLAKRMEKEKRGK